MDVQECFVLDRIFNSLHPMQIRMACYWKRVVIVSITCRSLVSITCRSHDESFDLYFTKPLQWRSMSFPKKSCWQIMLPGGSLGLHRTKSPLVDIRSSRENGGWNYARRLLHAIIYDKGFAKLMRTGKAYSRIKSANIFLLWDQGYESKRWHW